MPAIDREERSAEKTALTGGVGYRTLQLKNIGPDTNLRDLFKLFAQDFHPAELRLELIAPQNLRLAEAFITLPEAEIFEVQEWINGRPWKGQRLSAAVLRCQVGRFKPTV